MTPDFLPTNDAPPTPEEELDALETLDPNADADVVIDEQEAPLPVGRSYAWNFADRRFARAVGGGGPLGTRGDSTLVYWIEKALHTAQGVHPIYGGYGMERPFAEIGSSGHDLNEGDLQGRIHAALTFHPRIADVVDFYFEQDPGDETLQVSFKVIKDDGDPFTVSSLPVVL